MLGDLLSSRLFQGGLVFFVLVVGGSLLYSWHVHRTTEVSELGKKPLTVESLKNKQATGTAPVDFQTEGSVGTPDENTDTPISKEMNALPNETETLNFADAFLPEGFVAEIEPTENEHISPYGFGPYPEVPHGYRAVQWPRSSPEHELMMRVEIKLWRQGINTVGSGRDGRTGLIYPNIPGIIYIEWAQDLQPNGSVLQYASRYSGPPETVQAILNQSYNKESPFPGIITESDIPPGISVISYAEGGIDPYEFLELKKE